MNNQKQILLESLKRQGFSKPILDSFRKLKRENFISKDMEKIAYEDTSLSIGKGQTISQPYTIAVMLNLLKIKKGQKILEVGSGCGYVLALLSEMVGDNGKVYGIEIIKELFKKSKENLRVYKNLMVFNQNGKNGLKEKPSAMSQNQRKVTRRKPWCPRFDRIIISAASDKIPEPLIKQLKEKGILVAPIGTRYNQSLIAYQKIGKKLKVKEEIPGFVFVPFVDY